MLLQLWGLQAKLGGGKGFCFQPLLAQRCPIPHMLALLFSFLHETAEPSTFRVSIASHSHLASPTVHKCW